MRRIQLHLYVSVLRRRQSLKMINQIIVGIVVGRRVRLGRELTAPQTRVCDVTPPHPPRPPLFDDISSRNPRRWPSRERTRLVVEKLSLVCARDRPIGIRGDVGQLVSSKLSITFNVVYPNLHVYIYRYDARRSRRRIYVTGTGVGKNHRKPIYTLADGRVFSTRQGIVVVN